MHGVPPGRRRFSAASRRSSSSPPSPPAPPAACITPPNLQQVGPHCRQLLPHVASASSTRCMQSCRQHRRAAVDLLVLRACTLQSETRAREQCQIADVSGCGRVGSLLGAVHPLKGEAPQQGQRREVVKALHWAVCAQCELLQADQRRQRLYAHASTMLENIHVTSDPAAHRSPKSEAALRHVWTMRRRFSCAAEHRSNLRADAACWGSAMHACSWKPAPVRASAPGARTSRFSFVREAKLSSGPRPRHVKDVRVDSAVAALDRPLLPDLPCSVSMLRHL